MQALPAGGAMVAIAVAEDEVAPLVAGEVSIAAVNGPTSVVVSATRPRCWGIAAWFEAEGRRTRRLPVSNAFHSPLMNPMLEEFRTVVAGLSFHGISVTFEELVMSEQSIISPGADEVGKLYDRWSAECRDHGAGGEVANFGFGEHLHFGYWETPDEDVPVGVAALRLTDMVIDRLRVDHAHRVLDVGCGIGGPALRTARRTGAQVTGISVSQDQIDQATALADAGELAGRVAFRRADALNLPYPDGSFDAAFALESMMHMPDRTRALSEIGRVLRPGGRLVLTDFFERAPISEAHRPIVDLLLETSIITMTRAEDYPPMLRAAGMLFEEIVDISPHTTRRTFIEMSTSWTEWMRANPEAALDDAFKASIPAPGMVDVEEFGYLLLAAQKF